jgi:hypothetical protein
LHNPIVEFADISRIWISFIHIAYAMHERLDNEQLLRFPYIVVKRSELWYKLPVQISMQTENRSSYGKYSVSYSMYYAVACTDAMQCASRTHAEAGISAIESHSPNIQVGAENR